MVKRALRKSIKGKVQRPDRYSFPKRTFQATACQMKALTVSLQNLVLTSKAVKWV